MAILFAAIFVYEKKLYHSSEDKFKMPSLGGHS